jgi:hypothetical protein
MDRSERTLLARRVVKEAAASVETHPAKGWLERDEEGTWEKWALELVEEHEVVFAENGDEAVRQAAVILASVALEACLRYAKKAEAQGKAREPAWGADLAGLIESRVCRQTGRRVSIYRSSEAGLDEEAGKYHLVCEDHGQLVGVPSLEVARRNAPDPVSWCEECRAEEAKRR